MNREELRQLWQDLRADGWEMGPIYGDTPTSEENLADHDWELSKEGFKVHIYNAMIRGMTCGSVAAWGPDGLAVNVKLPYSMESLRAALQECNSCGACPVETIRYSFAGRCCLACRPKMAAEYEKPGWTD